MINVKGLVILLMFCSVSHARQEEVITNFCGTKNDIANCLKDYQDLPEFKKPPVTPNQGPIEIKVVPYIQSCLL